MPSTLGKYQVLREIGRGGGGVVYEARDSALGRTVALKTLRPARDLSPEEEAAQEERFLREARLAANLPKHPHLVGVYEAGLLEGRLYIAMEFVPGTTLSAWREKKTPSLRQQISVLRQASLGVEHAHRHGIIHRDLKPQNILVDGENKPRVADFGLAKQIRRDTSLSLTDQGMTVGTPTYMSPEQAEGRKNLDVRTDVWALGVLLYEILTGRPPFRSASGIDLLVKIVKDPVPPPSSVIPEGAHAALDPNLEKICLKALQKDKKDRYPSARAFGEDLDRWLNRQEVAAPPTRREWVAKRRRLGWMVGLPGAAAAVGLVAWALLSRSEPERNGASAALLRSKNARELVREGRAFLDSGKPAEAMRKFFDAGQLDPGQADARDGMNDSLSALQRAQANGKTAPAPSKTPPGPASAAEEAMAKAREFARAHPNDLEGQIQAWTDAQKQTRGTAWAEETDGDLRAVLSRQNESAHRDLVELDEILRVLRDAELFGPARERLLAAAHRHTDAEWTTSIAARKSSVEAEVKAYYSSVLDEAVRAKKRDDPQAVSEARRRVQGWKLGGLVEDFDQALARTSADASPAQAPASPAAEAPGGAPDPKIPRKPEGAPTPAAKGARPGQALPLEALPGHPDGVTALAFSGDGKLLLSGGADKTLRLWDLAQKKESRTLAVSNAVTSVALSPDGRWIAASEDQIVRIWDTAKFQGRAIQKHEGGVTRVLFSPDSRTLATSGQDGMVYFWEPASAKLFGSMEGHTDGATGMDFAPNGKFLAVAAGDGSLRLWDLSTRKSQMLGDSSGGALRAAAFSPDGKWIALGREAPGVLVWDLAQGRGRLLPARTEGATNAVAFSPDSRVLASGAEDGNILLWEAKSGELIQTLATDAPCRALAFSKKGDLLAAGGDAPRILLWDAAPLGSIRKK